MRHLMLGLLRALGVGNVVLASDGDEAWSKFIEHKPDVVITDAAMSPTDGFTLARRLRDPDALGRGLVPIIMISAHTEISAIQKARDIGITEFIRKPLAARSLYERLLAVVNRQQELLVPAALTTAIPAEDIAYL
tara:strand:- start:3273 stop:3677 length:405 start_codon:yes stop_codon:yes gene_type:complete